MSSTPSTAPPTSTIPAPCRRADVFDFLHTPEGELTREDRITVNENEANNLVAVTIETADGRCLSRTVPAECWQETDYRHSLIRSMRTLMA